jgi:hypothetical protein
MVQRSMLMAAMSEAKANKDEAVSKEQELQWHREQLSKAREQLLEARQEAGQMHISMGNMVQKSVLVELKAASGLHQDALQEQLRSLQKDKAALELLLQV